MRQAAFTLIPVLRVPYLYGVTVGPSRDVRWVAEHSTTLE